MSVIPVYFCDHCGHAFNHPENKGRGWLRINGRDEDDNDERCPRCANPDFELLIPEDDSNTSNESALRSVCALAG